ncbi:unnamed protein product [Rhizopus microsporus]
MRIWKPSPSSQEIGYIVQKGFDYPQEIDDQLNQLDISLISKYHPDKHTTHGINTFGANDHRDFEYKHPIIRITASDFSESWIKSLRVVHIISSAERAIEIINEWRQRDPESKTQFLWEPLPWACLPENLQEICEACQGVEIISPNHEETAEMLGYKFEELLSQHSNDFKQTVEYCARLLFDKVKKSTIKLVVRASKYGALVMTSGCMEWVPAYWDNRTDHDKVVDVTGAGNAFCGGYAAGWLHTHDPVRSALYGAVSASYVVEQIGVPSLVEPEQWNQGPSPMDRLSLLESKCRK